MHRTNRIQKVLKILARNVATNVQPELVSSMNIAEELNWSLSETQQILKIMQSMGVIESTLDVEFSLITKAGLSSLNQHQSGSGNMGLKSSPLQASELLAV